MALKSDLYPSTWKYCIFSQFVTCSVIVSFYELVRSLILRVQVLHNDQFSTSVCIKFWNLTEFWLTLLVFVFLIGNMSVGVKLERLVLSRLLTFVILLALVLD